MKSSIKKGKRRMILCIAGIALVLIAIFLLIQYIQCSIEVKKANIRLETYGAHTIKLNYGDMTYVDKGTGEEVILVAHGISGGYDQGFETVKDKVDQYRIIAPSRFGYLDSASPQDPSPKAQASAYIELLDQLGIDKVFILGTSAGGTIAIRFALDYPERTRGLILYSSAAPFLEKPESYSEYSGPPSFMCNDFPMWLLRPLFKPLMGMEQDTIYSMLPVSRRHDGMVMDASITNPDMARNFDQYPIEDLQVPSLILQSKDDALASYEQISKSLSRFPISTFISFEDGGHLMVGHERELAEAFDEFIRNSKE
ncbi:alpha/beta fold hydrolase [Paenibacillus sp. FSL K6-2524]|uniref:alpha/beta fold hydrolase n=1 Tax=Paenibacillus sp. FSL K6-2524 TaxID=2954516 RepID=UPI0030F64854